MNQKRIVIVTGANSGIGKATALALAGEDVHVVMVCRHSGRAAKALRDIRNKTGGSVELMICDLAKLSSVKDFCERFAKKHNRLDVLINNAGTLCARRTETPDGIETNFGVNFLGHFLLTNRLLPLLKNSAPSRIINVTSVAHRFAKLHFNDINLCHGYNWWRGYAQSKLAIVMSTYILSQKLEGSGVSVNCIHPGVVGTDIIVNRDSGRGSLFAYMHKLLFISPEMSAQPIVRLAVSEEADGISGRYFSRGTEKRSSRRSYDLETAKKLWALSEEMCGLVQERCTNSGTE